MSVVRIIESPHCRGFFLKKMYKNFVGTLETVLNIEVSVPSGSTVFEFLTQSSLIPNNLAGAKVL